MDHSPLPDPAQRGIFAGQGGALVAIAGFSLVLNVLAFGGPLFMAQVYDRVLPSRSEPTLVALLLILVLVLVFGALLDALRSRIALRVGARLRVGVGDRIVQGMAGDDPRLQSKAVEQLERLRHFLSSPQFLALADAPFILIFLFALFSFHPALGWFALGGTLCLLAISLVGQLRLPGRPQDGGAIGGARPGLLPAACDAHRAMGMIGQFGRADERRRAATLAADVKAGEVLGDIGAMARLFRQLLQSGTLAISAWLVIEGDMSAGAMLAASILSGRVLAPVEQLAAGWRGLTGMVAAVRVLQALPAEAVASERKAPVAQSAQAPQLVTRGLTVLDGMNGSALVAHLTMALRPGQGLAILGPNGSGKTALIHVLAGLAMPAAGEVDLGGLAVSRLREPQRRPLIGFLGHEDGLLDASVADNISRLGTAEDMDAIVEAARLAGMHERILGLPRGYATALSAVRPGLPYGFCRRIALARALYGAPGVLLLDAPWAGLDGSGYADINRIIGRQRAAGRLAVVTAVRAAETVACDQLLVIRPGGRFVIGPRQKVLENLPAPALTAPGHLAGAGGA